MPRIRINVAAWDYDRTRALIDGTVKPEGIELNYLPIWVEDVFTRMLKHKEFEVAEMSLSGYVSSLSSSDPQFIAIPVFLSRSFRHRSIYINTNSGIVGPSDLVGKRIGLPRFRQTACVWIRGMLAEYYGVPLNSVSYHTGGLETPEIESEYWGAAIPMVTKSDITVIPIGKEKILSRMLEEHELDAIYSARAPSSLKRGSKGVSLLFEDYRSAEKDYFSKTQIFPIMHTVVIRRDVYETNRWIAVSLLKAFNRAKQIAYNALEERGALRYMLPWMSAELEDLHQSMGVDYWPYGIQPNFKALETFLRYFYEQGLSESQLKPEEIFAPETVDVFEGDAFTPTLL